MSPTIKDKQHLPDLARPVAEQIERLGFKWEFDYEFPIPNDPATTARLQVRDSEHYAPTADVSRYAQAMKRGEKFPPGVVTRDGMFVDFNTRAQAARKLGWPTFQAFILNVDYARATSTERERILLLAASFNTHHGNRLTRSEIARSIQAVSGDGDWTAKRIAEILGITDATANSVLSQFRAERRAARLDVPFGDGVTASNKARLGEKDKMNDAPWRELARLCQDAMLTSTELRDLCKRMDKVKESDGAKIEVVNSERAARESQIAQFRATGRKRPAPSSEARQRLTWFLGYTGRVEDLVDYNPDSTEEYQRQIDGVRAVLRELSEAQAGADQQLRIPA